MNDSVRITPQHAIRHYIGVNNISVEQIGVAPYVVCCWSRSTYLSLVKMTNAVSAENWMYGERTPMRVADIDGRRVSFVLAPVGSPGTIVVMEEMIACGAHTFLGFGLAGGLQPQAGIGSLLLPTKCIRQEGTSAHYLPPDVEVEPNPELVKKLQASALALDFEVFTRPHWTTDAPFRELISDIEHFAKMGIYGVDMETSAMYALGQYRSVRVVNLLVVSDEVWHPWRPGFRTDRLKEAVDKAQHLVINFLTNL